MVSVVDVLDELYSTDADCWSETANNIYSILEFPVKQKLVCDWEKFIYEVTDTYKYLHGSDREVMKLCKGIALYTNEPKYTRLSVFSIYIDSCSSSRNDDVNSITKLFRRLFGPLIILMFINYKEVAFSGIATYQDRKRETIISEWFGLDKPDSVNEKLLEINPTYYSYSNISGFYDSYLWAIARYYARYRESKTFLLYGCGTFIEEDSMAYDEENDSLISSTKIDVEATYRANASYYPNMYGDDYFLDDVHSEETDIDDVSVSEADDLEWTMLELALEEEAAIINEQLLPNSDENSKTSSDSRLSGLTPEQMLQFIRNK